MSFSGAFVQKLIDRRAKLCLYWADPEPYVDFSLSDAVCIERMDVVLESGSVADIQAFLLLSERIDVVMNGYVPSEHLPVCRSSVLSALRKNDNVALPEESSDTPIATMPLLRTYSASIEDSSSRSCCAFLSRYFSCVSASNDLQARLLSRQ